MRMWTLVETYLAQPPGVSDRLSRLLVYFEDSDRIHCWDYSGDESYGTFPVVDVYWKLKERFDIIKYVRQKYPPIFI